MPYTILADVVVITHFLWIVFLIFGAAAGRRHGKIKYIHISGLAFAIIIQAFGWYCPLTHLEVWLRARHDPDMAYTGSYIIHYLEKIIYIQIDAGVIIILTALLCGVNALIYIRGKKAR